MQNRRAMKLSKPILGVASLSFLACVVTACAAETGGDEEEPAAQSTSEELSSVSCKHHAETGYVEGKSFKLTAVTVDGKLVQRATANAFMVMAKAAQKDGVHIHVVSGFRSYSEQKYLYHCYTTCSCNGCNLAAKPGYSNHESGHALDLNTSTGGVYNWLAKHGAHYGFKRTVPSEAWHWEWWGGGPGGGPC